MNESELLRAIASLPPIPGEHAPFTWDGYRYGLRNHILHEDVTNFTQWPTVQCTMFVGDFYVTRGEMRNLLGSGEEWIYAVQENWVGNPVPMQEWPHTSGNMAHQAYHLSQMFSDGSGVKNVESVVEFGGGYGALRYIFDRLGFSGKYTIYDVPEFSLLQEYYCSKNNLPTTFHWVENDKYTKPAENEETDLLIGLYSLSEVEKKLRIDFIESIHPRRILIAHQDAYLDPDLQRDFRLMCYDMIDYEWTFIENQYLPGHWYITGEKRQPPFIPISRHKKNKRP